MNQYLTFAIALTLSCTAYAADEEAVSEESSEAVENTGPDRSMPPEVKPPTALTLDELTTHSLSESASAHYLKVPGVRKVCIDLVFHKGYNELGGENALTDGLGYLMDLASENFGAQELSVTKDLHEISLTSSIDLHHTMLSLEVPVQELDKGLELLEDVLRYPTFPKSDVKRYVTEQTNLLEDEAPNSSRYIAQSASRFAWYPADSPYGARPDLEGLSKLNTKALQTLHRELLTGAPLSVLVIGNVDYETIESKLKKLVTDVGAPGQRPTRVPFTPPATQRVIAVDLPGNPQTRIALRMQAPVHGAPERLAAEVTNYALGGHFLSRLNTNLREEKGFTYGARSSYYSDHMRANWQIGVDVAVENTAASVKEIQHELARLVNEGVTEAELNMAVNSFTADWNSTMETAASASYSYTDLFMEELTIAKQLADLSGFSNVTVEQTKNVAKSYLAADKPHVWVFVGDREKLEPQLEAFNGQIEWLDRKQVILGKL